MSNREAKNKIRARNRAYVNGYKELHPCEVCGEARLICLDFHHDKPELKEFGMGDVEGQSLARIAAEIAKCSVLCANCHRVKHAEDKLAEAIKLEEYPLWE